MVTLTRCTAHTDTPHTHAHTPHVNDDDHHQPHQQTKQTKQRKQHNTQPQHHRTTPPVPPYPGPCTRRQTQIAAATRWGIKSLAAPKAATLPRVVNSISTAFTPNPNQDLDPQP